MPAHSSFDYAIIRVVPRVEREEFINVGVVLFCTTQRFLGARVEVDEARLKALAPDIDLETVRCHLDSFQRVCVGGKGSGPIGQLPQKERWHWLVAPRSTMLQTGPVHSGLSQEPQAALEHLLDTVVRLKRAS
ncbi:Protein of unknown function [Myxococcus fulvus]|uniref:DUF3037 domain-containing protein n=1 Tax=Myxococcus fulvus TaxID=33 RepID=A0A511SZV5_MYXFU|nr:DUF3037 domain-containing protein [Myxococcus fulvus]AKF79449.1 hypothetical protein MFUL124B02_03710 [Myxococcus fulvus 124B02]GEN07425.1 hypothetical protein MFU01_24620 [Myxococcus fulvus]SES91351.1 Protein of unknown function [Myxococcus fulvus]